MVLFTLPVPSTAFIDTGPRFEIRPRRVVVICYSYESKNDDCIQEELIFDGVEAYKSTYYRARSSSMRAAYDKLIDCGMTQWLSEIVTNLQESGESTDKLAHLMINFDDGPCYEIICRSYKVSQKISPLEETPQA